jgi:hypothetical protein
MIKKINKFMKKNKEMIIVAGTLLFILLAVLIGLTFDQSNGSKNLANVRRSRNGYYHENRCDFRLSCNADKASVDINESVNFTAILSNTNNCRGNRRYTWDDFSISKTSPNFGGGIDLSVTVNYSGVTRRATCANVAVNGTTGTGGNHECKIMLVNGVNSESPHFHEVARNVIINSSYGADVISGEGNKYKKVTVRSLLPKYSNFSAENANTTKLNIKNTIEGWVADNNLGEVPYTNGSQVRNKALVAAHSLGAISAHNYRNMNITPLSLDLQYLLYDPPFNAYLGPGWFTNIFNPPNQAAIIDARDSGIGSSSILWSNGMDCDRYPSSEMGWPPPLYCNKPLMQYYHSIFKVLPIALNDIQSWVRNSCEHIYPSG